MLQNRIVKRIYTNKTSLIGFCLVAFFLLVALLAPWLAPVHNKNNPYQMPQKSYAIAPQPPSAQNWRPLLRGCVGGAARVCGGRNRDIFCFFNWSFNWFYCGLFRRESG